MLDHTYTIPNRFGMRAILLIVSIYAVVLAVTKSVDAELRVVAPLLSFIVLVGLAQIFFGRIPRLASASVGGIVFPVSAYMDPMFDGRMRLQPISAIDLFWLISCGLLAGYMGGALLAGIFLVGDCLKISRDKVYAVPRKFGIATIFLATTLFAVLFAFLTWANARPWMLFFFSSFVVTIGLAQMFLPRSPRWASIVAGAVFLPLSFAIFGTMGQRWRMPSDDTSFLLTLGMVGLFVGYLGGTLIAGIFLLSDFMVKLCTPKRSLATHDALRSDEPEPQGALTLLAERAAASRAKLS